MAAADERTTVAVVTTRAAAGTSWLLGLGFGIPG